MDQPIVCSKCGWRILVYWASMPLIFSAGFVVGLYAVPEKVVPDATIQAQTTTIAVKHYNFTTTRIIDGDTLDVTIDLGFGLSLDERLRLEGIDAIERSHPKHKQAVLFIQSWLDDNPGAQLRTTTKRDKYGRILATIMGDTTLNDDLVENEFAVYKSY